MELSKCTYQLASPSSQKIQAGASLAPPCYQRVSCLVSCPSTTEEWKCFYRAVEEKVMHLIFFHSWYCKIKLVIAVFFFKNALTHGYRLPIADSLFSWTIFLECFFYNINKIWTISNIIDLCGLTFFFLPHKL